MSTADSTLTEVPEWLSLMETLASVHASTREGGGLPVARFGFRVGGLGMLLPAGMPGEVVAQPRVNLLPGTQPWFGGLLNLRGHLVPVFDLHRWLGETANTARYLFAIGWGDHTVAIWTDGLPEQRDIPASAAAGSEIPACLAPYVREAYRQAGREWWELDTHALFSALGAQITQG